MARFVGKRLVYASAGDAVRNADALLEKAVSGKAPIYHGGHAFRTSDLRELGREGYGHLMNGVSHMIPVVVAGGVITALSLLSQQLGLPASWTMMMKNVGSAAFVMMYPCWLPSSHPALGTAPPLCPACWAAICTDGTTTLTNLSWISSGFWGALIGGFAAGLIVLLLNRLLDRIPQELSHIKTGLLVPTCSLLFIGWLMLMIVNPPLGRFNRWMSLCLSKMQGGSRLLLGALLGGMMATDYGGPINKAAYVSGTLALVTLQYDLMAAVMGGRHGPAAGAGAGLYAVPDKIHRLGAPQRAPDCDHGTFLRDGGRSALRPARPASCRPLLYCRQCAGRLFGHLPRLRLPRPPWRIVSATRNGKSARLSGCAARRKLLAALLLGLLKKPLKQ